MSTRSPNFTSVICAVLAGLGLSGCTQRIEGPITAQRGGEVSLRASREARNILCRADPVMIDGNQLDLTISSKCASLKVTGSDNKITIDLAPGAAIGIEGSRNEVAWHVTQFGSERSAPKITDHGAGNTVRQLKDLVGAP